MGKDDVVADELVSTDVGLVSPPGAYNPYQRTPLDEFALTADVLGRVLLQLIQCASVLNGLTKEGTNAHVTGMAQAAAQQCAKQADAIASKLGALVCREVD